VRLNTKEKLLDILWAWKYGFDQGANYKAIKTFRNNWVKYELTTLRNLSVPDMVQDRGAYKGLVYRREPKNTLASYARKHSDLTGNGGTNSASGIGPNL